MTVENSVIIRGPRRGLPAPRPRFDFDFVQRELIAPALRSAGLDAPHSALVLDSGALGDDEWAAIARANLAVFDLTLDAATVFYVLGVRHALRSAGTVLICGIPRPGGPIPEVLLERCLSYDWRHPARSRDRLSAAVGSALRRDPGANSPCFHIFPGLEEPNVRDVVPPDFHEELERARNARSRGWLRLLAQEVEGLPFQWSGLRLIARAQRHLEDDAGSRLSWEAIVRVHPNDFEASAELARVYGRLYRIEREPDLLELCNIAIERALASEPKSAEERAAALALEGEHQAQRWWAGSAQGSSMSSRLLHSYESYRAAFLQDLNRFDVGVTALQMGTIVLHLSRQQGWKGVFATEHHADNYLAELTESMASLQVLVPSSIDAALKRMGEHEPSNSTRVRIASAETSFLSVQDDHRVLRAYRDATESREPSVRNALLEPLERFVQIGIRSDLAQEIIRQLRAATPASEPRRFLRAVVFAGCRIDGGVVSFVASPMESRVKDNIRGAIEDLSRDGSRVVAYASGAPGGDILWHEVCQELGIHSTLCLPMPVEDFARLNFAELDSWRARFYDLLGTDGHAVLTLSSRPEPPRWLGERCVDLRQRANDWTIQMALARGADRVTLLAQSSCESQQDAPGTAHLIRLARETGIHVERVDT